MNTVEVTGPSGHGAHRHQAVVGAGTLLVDFYDQLSQSGVLVPAGSCPTVGISGLALGGGVGRGGPGSTGSPATPSSRCRSSPPTGASSCADAAQTRTSTGRAGAGEGGTSASSPPSRSAPRPSPISPCSPSTGPWSAAAEVLGSWLAWQHAGPDELWSNCQLLSTGSGPGGAHGGDVRRRGARRSGSLVDTLVTAVGASRPTGSSAPSSTSTPCSSRPAARAWTWRSATSRPRTRPGTLDRAAIGGVLCVRVDAPGRGGHRRLRPDRATISPDAPRARRRARLRLPMGEPSTP